MNKYKLLLINPAKNVNLLDPKLALPPLWAAYITAVTPKNWEVELLDENVEKFSLRNVDLVAISTLTHTVNRAYEIASYYRQQKKKIVLGGIHASMMPQEALNFCDSVVIGEAETIWLEVIRDFENKSMREIYYGSKMPLEGLPLPDRSIFNEKYSNIATVQTTRGCPMDCDFCSVSAFHGGQYRMRPVNDVLEELSLLREKYVLFVDDNLIGYSEKAKNRAMELFKGMIRGKIKKVWMTQVSINFANDDKILDYAAKSGCIGVLYGIESIFESTLRAINKKINLKYGIDYYQKVIKKTHKFGIFIYGHLIVGYDGESVDIFKRTVDFLNCVKMDVVWVSLPIPYPGTKLFKRLREENRLVYKDFPSDWVKYHSGPTVLFKHKSLTKDQILTGCNILRDNLWSCTALLKNYFRTLRHSKSLRCAWLVFILSIFDRKMFFEQLHKIQEDVK